MVSWCGHEELCINHSSLQLSVSSHTANAHWEWGDVSSSHTSRCRELSPPTAMGTLIICSCWIGKLHYSVPGNVLSTIMTAVWIVLPGPYWPLSMPCLYLWCLRCPRSWDHWPLTTGHSLPGHHMATALPFHVPRPACCCCTRTTIPDLVVKTQFGENTHLSWTLHQENTLISRKRKS